MRIPASANLRRLCGVLPLLALGKLCFAQSVAPDPAPQPDEKAAVKVVPKPAEKVDDKVVALDPFVVSSKDDSGYRAANTLAGTRFNSRVKDLGSAMTIITPELMKDLDLQTTFDAISWAPNSTREFGDNLDTTLTAFQFLNYVSVRGFRTADATRDFFHTYILADGYNIERLTFSRGANSILFGMADPGGMTDQSLKRAKFNRNSGSVELRTDDEGSLRAALDANYVFNEKAALRVDVLHEDLDKQVTPQGREQKRIFVTGTVKPWSRTSIRANYENVDMITVPGKPFMAFEQVVPWINAGRPLTSGPVTTTPPAGLTRITTRRIIAVDGGAAGSVPVYDAQNQTLGAPYTISGIVNINTASLYPELLEITGPASTAIKEKADAAILSIEQGIGEDFILEFAYSYEDYHRDLTIANAFQIQVDTNTLLPSGAPNPNVGRYYTEAPMQVWKPNWQWEVARLTASYNLDFTKKAPSLRWLGRHNLAAMAYKEKERIYQDVYNEVNVTPLPGYPPSLLSGDNRIWRRTYLSDSKGGQPYTTDSFGQAINTGGVRSGWVNILVNNNENINKARVLATQSFFWNDRIVFTGGLRHDSQDVYAAPTQLDANGYPLNSTQQVRPNHPNSSFEDDTYTAGVVFHVLPQFSVFYNQSKNFRPPNAANTTIYDNTVLAPPLTGETKDYGVKVDLLGGKLVGSLAGFEGGRLNEVAAFGAGFDTKINAIWQALGSLDANRRLNSRDTRDYSSKGYEMELVYNPSRNWRVLLNGGHVETVESNSIPFTRRYIGENIATWKAADQTLPTTFTYQGQLVNLGTLLGLLNDDLENKHRQEGTMAANTRNYNVNLVTTYQFDSGVLKNFRVGAGVQWKSKMVIGYETLPGGNLVDVTKPYYSDDYYNSNFWVGYSGKVNDKVGWDLQLNVNNAFNEFRVEAQKIMDPATRQPVLTRYSRLDPRSISLTARLTF